jgi:hypothetical protein
MGDRVRIIAWPKPNCGGERDPGNQRMEKNCRGKPDCRAHPACHGICDQPACVAECELRGKQPGPIGFMSRPPEQTPRWRQHQAIPNAENRPEQHRGREGPPASRGRQAAADRGSARPYLADRLSAQSLLHTNHTSFTQRISPQPSLLQQGVDRRNDNQGQDGG